MTDPALTEFLRLSARLDSDDSHRGEYRACAARLGDARKLPAAAEAHGIAPLVHFHITESGARLPPDVQQQLAALALQHRHAARVNARHLAELIELFGRASIPVVVLKGAALAHVLYPSSDLRPLSDIDLLVEPRYAEAAQLLLGTMGYTAPLVAPSGRVAAHHHLPFAEKAGDGHTVRVEIHDDALARDATGSLTIAHLTEPPLSFTVDGRTGQRLGHADMLYHVCRHAAERAPLLRLIWVVDAVGYAARFHDEIDWPALGRTYPFVLNALSLLHLVTPLPCSLLEHVTPSTRDGLRGVGDACQPFTAIVQRGRPFRDIAAELFGPSDWWLRLHYGLDDRASVAWHRWVKHPLAIGHSAIHRLGAHAGWRVRRLGSRRTKAT